MLDAFSASYVSRQPEDGENTNFSSAFFPIHFLDSGQFRFADESGLEFERRIIAREYLAAKSHRENARCSFFLSPDQLELVESMNACTRIVLPRF